MKKLLFIGLGATSMLLTPAYAQTVNRLTVYDYSETSRSTNQIELHTIDTYSYNEYGFVSKTENINGDWRKTTEYRYDWERPGIWRARYCDQDQTQTIRTFHANGNVATTETTTYSGELIENYEFSEDGKRISGRSKTYSSATGEFYYVYNADNSITIHLDGSNRHTQTIWLTPGGNPITGCHEYYTSTGILSDISGAKSVHEDGKYICTSYTMIKQGLKRKVVATAKDIYSDNWFDNKIYSPNATYYHEHYTIDSDTGDETFTQKELYAWLDENILKYERSNADGQIIVRNYTLYEDGIRKKLYNGCDEAAKLFYTKGEIVSPDVLQVVDGSTADYYYECLDSKSNVLWRFENHDEIYWSLRDVETGALTPCAGKITLYDATANAPMEVTLDEQGRTALIVKTGTEIVTRIVYTYSDGEYSYDQYETTVADGVETLTQQFTKTTAGNVMTRTLLDNKASSGEKNEYDYNTHLWIRYELIDGHWEAQDIRGMDTIEYDAANPNIYTLISREVSDGKAINHTKTVGMVASVDGYWCYEEHYWDADKAAWIADHKTETQRTPTDVTEPILVKRPFYMPQDNLYYDYIHFQEGSIRPEGDNTTSAMTISPFYYSQIKHFSWDNDTNDWVLTRTEELGDKVSTDGNTTEITSLSSSGYTIYTIDSDNNLIAETNVRGDLVNKWSWEYDADGRLTRYVDEDADLIRQSLYTYSDIELSGISEIAADSCPVKIDGSTIIAGSDTAEVYNLQGIHVATVAPGTSATLPAGLYLIATKAGSIKALLK